MEFENRVAMVTGGTGALGSAVVMDLLASGARVAVPYRSEATWARLVEGAGEGKIWLQGSRVDLTDPEETAQFVQQTIEREGRIDFLVAAAGGFEAGKSYQTNDAAWERMLDLNLRSLIFAIRPVVPEMIRRNFGRIVTVSGGAILRGGGAGIAAYAVSKGAVRQLSEILSQELKDYNIHVHCVMPGTMDTPANRAAMPGANTSPWVKVEDVARVIHFMLGEQARAVRSAVTPVLG
jgi:NAD(P)-dependent dehydrogenase (short-subunit alcohol dehydrogenase family)